MNWFAYGDRSWLRESRTMNEENVAMAVLVLGLPAFILAAVCLFDRHEGTTKRWKRRVLMAVIAISIPAVVMTSRFLDTQERAYDQACRASATHELLLNGDLVQVRFDGDKAVIRSPVNELKLVVDGLTFGVKYGGNAYEVPRIRHLTLVDAQGTAVIRLLYQCKTGRLLHPVMEGRVPHQ